jgi:hypothetical protein
VRYPGSGAGADKPLAPMGALVHVRNGGFTGSASA